MNTYNRKYRQPGSSEEEIWFSFSHTEQEKKEYYENDLYKMAKISRLNFQLGAGAGIQWKNYQLKGGYDFGINSINKVDSNRILRHSGWYVSLVYEF